MRIHFLVCLCVCSLVVAGHTDIVTVVGCNKRLEDVHTDHYGCHQELTSRMVTMNDQELGGFICLTGKMHLFGMATPQQQTPDYVKAYYFIKLAAEIYDFAECRYYLGIMYNFKMTPHFTISRNLALKQNKSA
jgi:hypothetical protein